MPAPPLANSFEGSNTTVISTGNSGGASGDAFSGVQASPTYSTAQAKVGSSSMAITQGGTFAATSVYWSSLGVAAGVDVWQRAYVYLPAAPSAHTPIMRWFTSAQANAGQMQILTGRTINFTNAAFSGVLTGTAQVALNQWVRIECRIRQSTTVGQMEYRLFNDPDSTTATETNSVSSVVLGADFGQARFGMPNSGTVNQTWYFDEWGISATDWLGPVATATQEILPDADVTTTGWSTTPLWSKLSDDSDATVITATLA